MANQNFIDELKLATKTSTLRRTSNAGIGPGESSGAKMVFSSTNGPVVNGVGDKSKVVGIKMGNHVVCMIGPTSKC